MEISAGIEHFPVKPEAVKIIAEIIVRVDVFPAARTGVPPQQVTQTVGEGRPPAAMDRLLDRLFVKRAEQQQKIDELLDVIARFGG